MIRRNPMNGINWHTTTISSSSPKLSFRMKQNPNEPTFMIDLVSIIENFARSPRIISRILEECKKSLPGYAFCEYEDTIYFNWRELGALAYLLFTKGHISSDNQEDIIEFWKAHWKELMTEYPKRDQRIQEDQVGNSSDQEEDPSQKECYFYAQYGQCEDPSCKNKHSGAQHLSSREYREAVREDKWRMRRRADFLSKGKLSLPVLSRRKSSSSFAPTKRKRKSRSKKDDDDDEEEFNPDEIDEIDEDDQEMMQMIIDQDDDEYDEDDEAEADFIHDPQRRLMQFDERQTLIHLNTQTISSLTAAGQYFLNRQEDGGGRNYDRVLEEIDAGVTNAVNELQRVIPVGNRAEIQVQDVLGDEYLESAVRMTKRVTELGHSLRDIPNDEFREMMKQVGIRASDLHKQVYGRKPKKVAMSVGSGGRKYFNYYSEQTAPRTLDVAIGEWFRDRAQNADDQERGIRQMHFGDKRPRLMDDDRALRQIEEEMEEIAREEEEFYALVQEAENQPEQCPNCDDGHLENGSCINNCGYNNELEQLAEEQRLDQEEEISKLNRTVLSVVSDFFSPK